MQYGSRILLSWGILTLEIWMLGPAFTIFQHRKPLIRDVKQTSYSILLCNSLFFRNSVLKILILSNVATCQRKSTLKKCREELQLCVAGWFRGRAGRARLRGCRGRLLGSGYLADGPHCKGRFVGARYLADGLHAVSSNNRRWRSCREATERCSAARYRCGQETGLVGGTLIKGEGS